MKIFYKTNSIYPNAQKKIGYVLHLLLFFSSFCFSQNKVTKPAVQKARIIKCTTFVYNLSLDEMKFKDICFNVSKGEYINLNDFSREKKKKMNFGNLK